MMAGITTGNNIMIIEIEIGIGIETIGYKQADDSLVGSSFIYIIIDSLLVTCMWTASKWKQNSSSNAHSHNFQ